jgi:germination protein M
MRRIAYIIAVVLVTYSLAGCTALFDRHFFNKNGKNSNDERNLVIDPDPQPTDEHVVLYFKHQYADLLVEEERIVQKGKQSLEQLVVEELLKGPLKHERIRVMPSGVNVLSVTRYGDTVFVDFSKEFLNNIDISAVFGKENIPQDQKDKIQGEAKRLAIYSVVNSITRSVSGVYRVKILVDSRSLSYEEMGVPLMASGPAVVNTPMPELYRDKDLILTAEKTVEQLLKSMVGEPDLERVYSFLASKTMSNNTLPTLNEFREQVAANPISLEFNDRPIIQEDVEYVTGGIAYVPARFTIKYPGGSKLALDKYIFTVVNQQGIWKVRLPNEFIQVMKFR